MSDKQAQKQASDWNTMVHHQQDADLMDRPVIKMEDAVSLNALSDDDQAHIPSNPDYKGDVTGNPVSLYWWE